MKATIINPVKEDKKFVRIELSEFVDQLRNGTYSHQYLHDFKKEVCFAAEWAKTNGQPQMKTINRLVLLSLENLRDLATCEESKRLTSQQPYTLLCFIGHDGHSLHIVSPYEVTDG